MREVLAMPLYNEGLERSLGSSPQTFESYVAIKAVTRESTNIWHMDHISEEDRIQFAAFVMHHWLQRVPGYMARVLAGLVTFTDVDLRAADTYLYNAFECISALHRVGENSCGISRVECPISNVPSFLQMGLLKKLGSFVVYGGRSVFLENHVITGDPIYVVIADRHYPLRLNIDICHIQKWYDVGVFVDDWCKSWLQDVVRLSDVEQKTSLCRTNLNFGPLRWVFAPSVFVSTAPSIPTSADYFTLATHYSDRDEDFSDPRVEDYNLDSLAGWSSRTQCCTGNSTFNKVTRFLTQYSEYEFGDVRERGAFRIRGRQPILYPYNRKASEALVADNSADDNIWSSSNIITFVVAALLFMALGALIAYSYSRYRERHAPPRIPDNRNAERTTELPPATTLQNIELQPLTHATCGRQ